MPSASTPPAYNHTNAPTPNVDRGGRQDGDPMTSQLQACFYELEQAKTAERDTRAILKLSRNVRKAIQEEAAHVQNKIKHMETALHQMSQQAVAGGIQKKNAAANRRAAGQRHDHVCQRAERPEDHV